MTISGVQAAALLFWLLVLDIQDGGCTAAPALYYRASSHRRYFFAEFWSYRCEDMTGMEDIYVPLLHPCEAHPPLW